MPYRLAHICPLPAYYGSRPQCRPARLAVAGLALALCSTALHAQATGHEFGIDLIIGRSHVHEDGHRGSGGLNLSWRPPGWWVGPELGRESQTFSLLLDDRRETSAGLRLELPLGSPGRFILGGGRAWLREEWAYEGPQRSQGWYVHAGAMWPVGARSFWMGVDARAVRAHASDDGDWKRAGSADRIALLLAWRL